MWDRFLRRRQVLRKGRRDNVCPRERRGGVGEPTLSVYRLAALVILLGFIAIWSAPLSAAGAQQDTQPNVAQLIEQLRDKDAEFRRPAAEALERLGGQEKSAAVPALIELLKDEQSDVRRSAAEVLGAIGAEAQAAVPALIEMLKGAEINLRSSAAEALERIRTADIRVREEDGLLSVRTQNARLGWLLDEISRKFKIAVIMGEGVDSQRVSVAFSDLPLDQGLRRILTEQDAFFYYRGGARLLTIWVYLKNAGRGLYPVPRDEWASTAELDEVLRDWDPAERAWAIETLVERRGELARDAVLQALEDEDERVRTNALYGALDQGIEVPVKTLSRLALEDPSLNIRFLALEALTGDPNLESVATWALDDPHPMIRDYAARLLDRLDRAGQPTPASQPAQGQSPGN